MKIKIEVNLDNDTFYYDGEKVDGSAIAELLRAIADRLEDRAIGTEQSSGIRDVNGNTIGKMQVLDD